MYDVNLSPWDTALRIHEYSEPGSSEFKSSELLINILRYKGFNVIDHYLGIETAFRATKKVGSGKPSVAFLAEYDALPGIGHACGHNLIASAAAFSAIRTAEIISNGTVNVIGTPDEEGTGRWSGSKIIMAEKGAFKDIDLVLGSHPSDEWSVGRRSLLVRDYAVEFKGFSSHEAASPELGRSALDAAILTYTAVNMLRQHVRRDANVVMHGIIKEGGKASNVTPDRSLLTYGIRSSDPDYHGTIVEKFRTIVDGCAKATFTDYEIREIGPLFSITKINPTLSNYIRNKLIEMNVACPTLQETWSLPPGGSTDFANVSQVVPALELDFQVARRGTPWHSNESLKAAISDMARKSLNIVIRVLSETAKYFTDSEEFRDNIRRDFIDDPMK